MSMVHRSRVSTFHSATRRWLAAVVLSFTAAESAWSAQSTFDSVVLGADITFWGNVSNPATWTPILSKEFPLEAGESRRVVNRLALSLSTTAKTEVDNQIYCEYLDPTNGWQFANISSSGTNHVGATNDVVVLRNSLLLTAASKGIHRCQVLAYASNGRTDFFATARRVETSMMMSATNEVGSAQWRYQRPQCGSGDSGNHCEYLGAAGGPIQTTLFSPADGTPTLWTAPNNATKVDLLGTIQVTSCYSDTASCAASQRGPSSSFPPFGPALFSAQIESTLRFDQLYPDGTVCRMNSSWDQSVIGNLYGISNDVHHFPITYQLSLPVSQNCMGSRTFRVGVYMRWYPGNPIKIDGGVITAINSVRSDSLAAVPNVIGLSETQAVLTLQAGGFKTLIENRVMNPAPGGSVFTQNAPGGTVEPTGATVNMQVSLGQATVPSVLGSTETQARQRVVAANLTVGTVSKPPTCVDPGFVSYQSIAPGTQVVPGTPVELTVPGCKNGGPRQ